MNKTVLLLCLIGMILIGGCTIDSNQNQTNAEPDQICIYSGEFDAVSLSDGYGGPYFDVDSEGNIINLHSEIREYGEIKTARDAGIVFEEYCEEYFEQEFKTFDRPHMAWYDKNTKIWMIVGSENNEDSEISVGGGWVTVLIKQENGEILSSWISE